MAANIRSMASSVKTWHGLELRVDPMDAQQAFVYSGQSKMALSLEDLTTSSGLQVGDFKALIERNTGEVIHVHGKDYTFAEPWKLYQYFAPYIESLGAKYITAGVLGDFSKVWALAEVKNLEFNIGKGDNPVMPYFLTAIGYDGKIGFAYGLTCVQVVCQNTLRAALKGDLTKFRQTKNSDARIVNSLSTEAMNAFFKREAEELSYTCNSLAEVSLTSELKKAFIDFILPLKKDKAGVPQITDGIQEKRDDFDEAMESAPGIVKGQENAYSLYDAFTYAMTHGSKFGKREKTDGLVADLFGSFEVKREEVLSWLVNNAR